ncbi:MAG: HEAT repeat domain-containing protein [Candidatus Omnitrophota bacterium]
MVRALLLILLFILVPISSSYSAQHAIHNSTNYIPATMSIKLWIKEALRLSDDIESKNKVGLQEKRERFDKIVSILIVIGNRYPERREYYRDIMLADNNSKKKALIAAVLSALEDEQLPNILVKLLEDKDPANRATAIMYGEDIKDRAFIDKLAHIVNEDPDIRIRRLAFYLLYSLDVNS